jgi:EF hand
MKKLTAASILALTLAAAGSAWAQTSPTTPPATPSAPPAATAPAVTMDPAVEAKFKAADKSGTGFIEGAALEPYKPMMDKIDTNKDGKISRAEFAAAAKAGVIK